jgi:hypothetical protein
MSLHGLIDVLFHNFPGGTEENYKEGLSQVRLFPAEYSNVTLTNKCP